MTNSLNLSRMTNEEIGELYDSGFFNHITIAYVRKALTNLNYSQDQINEVVSELRWLHESRRSDEI